MVGLVSDGLWWGSWFKVEVGEKTMTMVTSNCKSRWLWGACFGGEVIILRL